MKTCLPISVFLFASIAAAQSDTIDHNDLAKRLLSESQTGGGLVVHLGCGDGDLISALASANKAILLHGMDANDENVQACRRRYQSSNFSTRVSVEQWAQETLPHSDNLVNLLIIEDTIELSNAEAMRVLVPGGSVFRRSNDQWTMQRKPPADSNRDWTHYQYDATNNPVGEDPGTGLPRQFQWAGKPLWSAAHESMASLNAMVSAKGRLFYIIDEGPRASIQLPADWQLVARDAHNGVVLWKKPLKQWLTRYWPWKSGPAQMPRKLIAVDDRVYVPLDINGPLIQLDAATGRQLQTYQGTGAAEEVIHTEGILLVQVDPDPSDMAELERERQMRRHFNYDNRNRVVIDHDKAKRIVAVEAESGKELWTRIGPRVLPLTLSALGGNVVYHDGRNVICLDLKTGEQKWKSEELAERLAMHSEDAPTLVLHQDAVLFVSNKKMTALSMHDGTTLWKSNWTEGDYRSPATMMLINDLAWSMNITSARGKWHVYRTRPVDRRNQKAIRPAAL